MDGEISSDLMMQNLSLKRKRSPRQRQWNSSSSDDDIADRRLTMRSSFGEDDDEEEEEHQAAKCLMLLSQSKSWLEKKINGGLYECKTCNRTFQSFQALGGHRTSHKKMKMKSEEFVLQKPTKQLIVPIALHIEETSITNRKVRIHKCLICNAVFASGQALGGHMRRHRVTISEGQTSDRIETKSDGVTLSLLSPEETGNEASRSNNDFQCLDLNFPVASDDEIGESRFCFDSKRPEQQQQQIEDSGLVFPALVNCHY